MSERIEEALAEGVAWMEYDESFSQYEFDMWYSDYVEVLDLEQIADLYSPSDENWRRQWLILATLGVQQDEKYWDIFRLAYAEDDEIISGMGRWCMELTNPVRAGYEIGLGQFFAALAYFAELEFCATGGQLTLF